LAYFGLAGEKGAATSKGPGTFQIALLDALFTIDEEELGEKLRIEG
jgi:hydroxyethylthiazole kinase